MTDWMAARLVKQNYVQKIDHANTPNLPKNIIAGPLHAPEWDPARDYSAPWQSGLTGVCYNNKKTKAVRSIKELLTRPDLKGKIAVLTEMRDTIGLIMLDQGKDPGKFTDDDFNAAIAMLQQAKDTGQIRAFTGNEYIQSLKKGDLVACMAWSGDVIAMQADRPEMTWAPPEAGRHAVGRQHADPQQVSAQEERRAADELLLRPEDRGAAGGLRQLHLPGRGRPGSHAGDRPRAWPRTP